MASIVSKGHVYLYNIDTPFVSYKLAFVGLSEVETIAQWSVVESNILSTAQGSAALIWNIDAHASRQDIIGM
jgi:hypothetical protein